MRTEESSGVYASGQDFGTINLMKFFTYGAKYGKVHGLISIVESTASISLMLGLSTVFNSGF